MALGRMLSPSTEKMRAGGLSDQTKSLVGQATHHQLTGRDIHGKTLGIIGSGRIGSVAATLASAIGMRVLMRYPYMECDVPGATQVDYIDTIYRESDFVSVNAPLTPETRDMISCDELKIMKDTAYMINAGRGGVVN